MDSTIDHYVASSIEPLVVIIGSPPWSKGGGDYQAPPHGEPLFTSWVNAFAAFVPVAVNRYKDRVKRWEIWNEQNDIGFWPPRADVDEYIKLYNPLYAAVKSADPTAEVAMGAMSAGCCTGPDGMGGFTYLQEMYDRGVYPDIVNIHPYAHSNQAPDVTIPFENNFTDIAEFRRIMVANGQGSKPIWVTEWGWGSDRVGLRTQADYVEKSLEMIRDLYPYVTVATIFSALDFSNNAWKTGLVNENHQLKPAGVVFRDFVLAQSR
jgi:hypothetical protein